MRRMSAPVAPTAGAEDPLLADRAFHLDLNEAVHLDRIFQRELFDDRLDEAGDDHRGGFGLRQSARHQIKELFVPDLRDGRFVADFNLVLVDPHVRIRV